MTDSVSYAVTCILAAPSGTWICGLLPPMIVFSDAVTSGSPRPKPSSVSAADSGIGKTGCGWSPKTRPENQRLVGGTSPSASRVGAILATFFWVIPARSAWMSAGDAAAVTAASPEPADSDEPEVGSVAVFDVQPATRAAPAISSNGLVSVARRVRRSETEVVALSLIFISLTVSML